MSWRIVPVVLRVWILRCWRRAEFARIAWRDLAGWATLDETLADLSRAADDALRMAHIPVTYVTYADGETDVAKRAMDKITEFLQQNFPAKSIDKKPPSITRGPLPY